MNKIKCQKRQISDHKFGRIFSQNLDKTGVAYITKDWVTLRSLSAVKIGNFVYAKFQCAEQEQNRLKTYHVRYDLDNPLDFIAFSKYSVPVFAVCEL